MNWYSGNKMGKRLRKQHGQRLPGVRNPVCPRNKRTSVTGVSMQVRVVKINKRKSPLEGSQEAAGVALLPSTPWQLLTQQEKRHLVGLVFYYPSKRKESFLLPWPSQ